MKKALSVLFVLLAIITLAGCQEIVPTEETVLTETPSEVIESPTIIENPMIIEVYSLNQTLLFSDVISYPTDTELSVFEVIANQMDIDYTMSQFGAFVNGIMGYYPKEFGASYNYMFSLYVNDVISNVGISSVTYVDGLKITFKEEFASWLDHTDFLVDQIIYQFIDERLAEYINNDFIDYHVLSALNLLKAKGYISIDFKNLVDDPALVDPSNSVKQAFIGSIFNLDTTSIKNTLETTTITGPWQAVNILTALSLLEGSETVIHELIESVAQTFDFMDPDYVGMAMLALAKHQTHQKTIDILPIFENFITSNLTEQGITSWGSANASSTATVIIGLVAQGYNPRSETFTSNQIDLIEALLSYYSNGGFKWQNSNESLDLLFSTPQAFAALVVYKLSRDVWGNPAVDLFDFS
jgi:hypothetical protein